MYFIGIFTQQTNKKRFRTKMTDKDFMAFMVFRKKKNLKMWNAEPFVLLTVNKIKFLIIKQSPPESNLISQGVFTPVSPVDSV